MRHQSAETLHVLSTKTAHNTCTGALTVNGGVGINKNLIIGKELVTNELICRESGKIGGDLFINGNITVGEMFSLNSHGNISYRKSLVSETGSDNIGTYSNRWNNIFNRTLDSILMKSRTVECDKLDVYDNIELGKNEDGRTLMRIRETIEINGIMSIEPQIIIIDNEVMSAVMIIPKRSIIIIDSKVRRVDVSLSGVDKKNSYVKLVIRNGKTVYLEDLDMRLKKGDYIDLLWMDDEYVCIGKN